MLSSSCQYGIRAAAYLANPDSSEGGYVPIRTISRDLGISFHFLTKILQSLTQDKILVSCRGPKGGVALARPAREITLQDIVTSIDGPHLFTTCILGLPKCSDSRPCAMHGKWATERNRLSEIFGRTTLAQLASGRGVRA